MPLLCNLGSLRVKLQLWRSNARCRSVNPVSGFVLTRKLNKSYLNYINLMYNRKSFRVDKSNCFSLKKFFFDFLWKGSDNTYLLCSVKKAFWWWFNKIILGNLRIKFSQATAKDLKKFPYGIFDRWKQDVRLSIEIEKFFCEDKWLFWEKIHDISFVTGFYE